MAVRGIVAVGLSVAVAAAVAAFLVGTARLSPAVAAGVSFLGAVAACGILAFGAGWRG